MPKTLSANIESLTQPMLDSQKVSDFEKSMIRTFLIDASVKYEKKHAKDEAPDQKLVQSYYASSRFIQGLKSLFRTAGAKAAEHQAYMDLEELLELKTDPSKIFNRHQNEINQLKNKLFQSSSKPQDIEKQVKNFISEKLDEEVNKINSKRPWIIYTEGRIIYGVVLGIKGNKAKLVDEVYNQIKNSFTQRSNPITTYQPKDKSNHWYTPVLDLFSFSQGSSGNMSDKTGNNQSKLLNQNRSGSQPRNTK